MAPDAEILPRSRSRHLLRQETGAPALRKMTRWRIDETRACPKCVSTLQFNLILHLTWTIKHQKHRQTLKATHIRIYASIFFKVGIHSDLCFFASLLLHGLLLNRAI